MQFENLEINAVTMRWECWGDDVGKSTRHMTKTMVNKTDDKEVTQCAEMTYTAVIGFDMLEAMYSRLVGFSRI